MISKIQLTLLIVTTVAYGCQSPAPDMVMTGHTMGTEWTVRFGECPQTDCVKAYQQPVETLLESLNNRFSHYREDSELSRFNRHNSNEWFAVSAELAELVNLALKISTVSKGAFDITVAPAVNAWGFGPADSVTDSGKAPDADAISTAVAHSGYQKLQARLSPPALRKSDPLLKIDMSAIAKGHAVDRISYLLEGSGVSDYLVDIGGEVRTAGARPDGKSWRVGIEQPDAALPVEFIVVPGNQAVATSGDYRNYRVIENQQRSHTIDPATGEPVAHSLSSVSVIAPNTAQADALATALMVMGPERGPEYATREKLAALFIIRDPNGPRTRHTPEFASYLLDQ
jgi:thiamine biosynthesis lipoprotein